MRVLLILLEFPTWLAACGCSYAAQLAIEEGLRARDVEFLTVTGPWLGQVRELCAGKQFDQVWIEIARQEHLPTDLLEWLTTVAPVRVGFTVESLEYTEEEYLARPPLRPTRARFESRVTYMTHIAACDEYDAARTQRELGIPAIWWPQAVPKRFVVEGAPNVPEGPAVFRGTIYGERKLLLENPMLAGRLVAFPTPEGDTDYPARFDKVHSNSQHFFMSRRLAPFRRGNCLRMANSWYLHELRKVREDSFRLWLDALKLGCASVNLPHLVKTYAGRVVESMAAGRPVISWELPDRPRNREIFQDGEEILLFDKDQPEHLAEQIGKLQHDPVYRNRLEGNARKKLLRYHTMEHRVGQILDWLEKGQEPVYY